MLLINLIGVVLTACVAGACIVVVMGIIFDFLGFYDRMEKMEHHLDNDEYDYGHNVNHKAEEQI